MASKPQRIFGVYQDMTSLKIATLLLMDKRDLRIVGLDSIELPESEELMDDVFMQDFDFNGKSQAADAFDDLLNSDNIPTDGTPLEAMPEEPEEERLPTRAELIKAATEENAMHDGRIALNLDVFNVNYREVASSPGNRKSRLLQDVKATMASDVTSAAVFRWFAHDDENVIGVSSQGSMELLESMLDAAQTFPKRYLRICSIQPNEVALINALRMHYNLEQHEVSAVFYIGQEYSRVLVLQDGNFLAALPIFNEGSASDNIMMKVHSRYLLDMQQHNVPELDRIFVAGDGIDEDMLDYLRDNESQAKVELLLPLIFPVDTGEDISPEKLSEFIIPIMLGAALAFAKDTALVQVNFTPRKLLERQNIFSLGIPSVLILATVVGVLYLGASNALSLSQQNRTVQLELTELQKDIAANMAIIDSIAVLERQITEFEQKSYYVRHFIGNNNQWHYILKELSTCFQGRPLSWATNIRREGSGFQLEGSTSDRRHVLAVSQLFPGCQVNRISEKQVEGYTVWDYDVTCEMPDYLLTRRGELEPDRTKFGEQVNTTPEVALDADQAPPKVLAAASGQHKVTSGESLSSIARDYATTVAELSRLNNLREETIYIGQMLKVPGKDNAPPQQRTYSPQTAPELEPGSYQTYEVQDGDNLFRVALRFGTTVEEIRRVNGLETEVIYTGQALKIPTTE